VAVGGFDVDAEAEGAVGAPLEGEGAEDTEEASKLGDVVPAGRFAKGAVEG
jgi:hypothetical protein